MCHNQDRACQQRGINEQWEKHLPRNTTTRKGLELGLRVLCPGEISLACEGDFSKIISVIASFKEEQIRMRFFHVPEDVATSQRKMLRCLSVVIGAYAGDMLVGLLDVTKATINDAGQKVIELAFSVHLDFPNQGIGGALYDVGVQTLEQVVGSCIVHIVTLRTNASMNTILLHRGILGRVPADDLTVKEYDYEIQAA